LLSVGAQAKVLNLDINSDKWICNGKPAVYSAERMMYSDDKTYATGTCQLIFKQMGMVMYLDVDEGIKDGNIVMRYLDNNAVQLEGKYKKDKLEGLIKAYYLDRTIAFEMNLSNDLLNGLTKYYYPSGKLYQEMPFSGGFMEGKKKIYFEDGVLGAEESFVHGSKDGKAIWYYSNGEKAIEMVYKSGKFIKGFCIDKSGQKKALKEEKDLNRVSEICEKPVGAEYVVDKLRLGAGLPQPK
jgi:antitoxin component YwqK of YwqJK toxin-antitoxin module